MHSEEVLKGISILIIGILIGYSVGYFMGVSWALNWGIDKAIQFAEKQGIEIKLSSGMIATALYQYQNNIGGCLFTEKENASIHNNTGN